MYITTSVLLFSVFKCFARTEKVIVGTSEFSDVRKSAAYVDKTLLLKEIFNRNYWLFTGPRGFLKSTNLNMIKTFLTINIDEDGEPIDPMKTENYKLFTDLNIYKEERQFFDTNVGECPVIHLDLKCGDQVKNYGDALDIFKKKVRDSYLQHKYLTVSDRLSESQRELCRKWCKKIFYDDYRHITEVEALSGLGDLAGCLYTHFRRRMYLLIDEYDSIITEAMVAVHDDELEAILNLVVGRIASLIKPKSNPIIKGALITGMSHIAGANFSKLANIETCKFLYDHDLSDFYGFTESEVENIFENYTFNLSPDNINKARQYYNGYTSMNGKHFYSPLSILKFLKFGRVDTYWEEVTSVNGLEVFLNHPAMLPVVETLMQNNSVPVDTQIGMEGRDIFNLRDTFLKPASSFVPSVDLVLSHIVDLGYLCFDYQNTTSETLVKIPNTEIWYYMNCKK